MSSTVLASHLHSHSHLDPSGSGFISLLAFLATIAGLYAFALVKEKQKVAKWRLVRAASFMMGLALIAIAMTPALDAWAHSDLKGHMVQHLLLGMYAPLALVLGAPGMLLLRNLPVHRARQITWLLSTNVVRLLIHPITALVLNMGGMAILYLTPVYALSVHQPVVHFLVHLHFILAGYLFTWSVAGPDPAPHRPHLPLRLLVLFIGTAIHATLSKWMYAYGYPRGTGHELEELQTAAKWMYYGGDVAEMLLAAVFFSVWFKRKIQRNRAFLRGEVSQG